MYQIKTSISIQKSNPEYKEFESPNKNKLAGIVCPICYENIDGIELDEPVFIMFRSSGGKRKGLLEFPGGRRDISDKSTRDTAAREAFEETCEYLDIDPDDLIGMPHKLLLKTSVVYYVRVNMMTNFVFQKNLEIERLADQHPGNEDHHDENDHNVFLEMDKLVRIPISEFHGPYPTSKKQYSVTSDTGKKYKVWNIAACAAWNAAYEPQHGDSIIDVMS